jgi:hypothetical protein
MASAWRYWKMKLLVFRGKLWQLIHYLNVDTGTEESSVESVQQDLLHSCKYLPPLSQKMVLRLPQCG